MDRDRGINKTTKFSGILLCLLGIPFYIVIKCFVPLRERRMYMKQLNDFRNMKKNGEKIVMLTAYDYPSAKQAESCEVDLILVGDSLGMVVLGYDSTIPVTTDDMIHHSKAVRRGAPNTFTVVDMPFMSYHLSVRDTLMTAAKMMQETGAQALKLEGADGVLEHIQALTKAGIPVCAHLGLTPQSVAVLGGYKVQGKDALAAKKLIQDALLCEEAGAFMLVLECVPKQLGREISNQLSIPVIGIGAGVDVDGQVLVYHDVVTYGVNRVPKFVKPYSNVDVEAMKGISAYVSEVKNSQFPSDDTSFSMKEEELKGLYGGER
jgi:3-methyl-2-oxobutanoate hydroxymethyltransferase